MQIYLLKREHARWSNASGGKLLKPDYKSVCWSENAVLFQQGTKLRVDGCTHIQTEPGDEKQRRCRVEAQGLVSSPL